MSISDISKILKKEQFVFIIPVYNHEQKIAEVIAESLKFGIPIFVVDDGSTDLTYDRIKDIRGITVLRHRENRGKGAAIITGMTRALGSADWAITIDADGQHDPRDIIPMIRGIPPDKRTLMIGMRQGMAGKAVPWTSRFGRRFSNLWVRLAGGPAVSDSQSGFRIYPLPESLNLNVRARRFQFEVEILVRAEWKKIPVTEVPVSVSYRPGTGRISHFRPFADFLRNSETFARLIIKRFFMDRES